MEKSRGSNLKCVLSFQLLFRKNVFKIPSDYLIFFQKEQWESPRDDLRFWRKTFAQFQFLAVGLCPRRICDRGVIAGVTPCFRLVLTWVQFDSTNFYCPDSVLGLERGGMGGEIRET